MSEVITFKKGSKRSCDGCKALLNGRCMLGYKNEPSTFYNGIAVLYRPLERCPKPKTKKRFEMLKK